MARRVRIRAPPLEQIRDNAVSVAGLVPNRVGVGLEEVCKVLLRLVGVQREQAGDEGALEHGALLVEGAGKLLGKDVVCGELGEGAAGESACVLGGVLGTEVDGEV
jgi:hypothetical protein